VFSGPVNLRPRFEEPAVELTELFCPALDLHGDVVDAQDTALSSHRGLAQGDIVMLCAKGQKRHLALRVVRHDLHTQRLSIKRHRGTEIADVQDDVSDFVDLRHTIPPVLGVTCHRASSMACR
jgi:hypothetical protein